MIILFTTIWTIVYLTKCRPTSFCQNIIKEYRKSNLNPYNPLKPKPYHSGRFDKIITAYNLLNEEDKKQHNAEIVRQEDQGLTSFVFKSLIQKVDDKIEKNEKMINERFDKLIKLTEKNFDRLEKKLKVRAGSNVEKDAVVDQSYSYYDVEKDAAEKGDHSYTYYDELSGSGEGNY